MEIKYTICEQCIHNEMHYDVYEVSGCSLGQSIENTYCECFEKEEKN